MDGFSTETVSAPQNCRIALHAGQERSQVELPSNIVAEVQTQIHAHTAELRFSQKER